MEESRKQPAKQDNFKGSQGIPFTPENQPSPESKSAGWAKKRKGQELVKYILEQKFIGAKDGNLKREIAEYFGCDESEITNEMAMLFRQAQKAISKADTPAFKAVQERAHGQPKQQIEQTGNIALQVTRKIIGNPAKSEPDLHSGAE